MATIVVRDRSHGSRTIPITKSKDEMLCDIIQANIAINADIDNRYPGLIGLARAWQLMMGDNRNEEYLAQNGARFTGASWLFSDGSILPNKNRNRQTLKVFIRTPEHPHAGESFPAL